MGAHPGAPDMDLEIRDWKSSQEGPAAEGNVEGSGRSAGRELGGGPSSGNCQLSCGRA